MFLIDGFWNSTAKKCHRSVTAGQMITCSLFELVQMWRQNICAKDQRGGECHWGEPEHCPVVVCSQSCYLLLTNVSPKWLILDFKCFYFYLVYLFTWIKLVFRKLHNSFTENSLLETSFSEVGEILKNRRRKMREKMLY